MTNFKIKPEKIEKIIKESAKFYNITLAKIDVRDEEDHYWIRLEDNDCVLIDGIIIKNNVISVNDLDNQVTAIVKKLA